MSGTSGSVGKLFDPHENLPDKESCQSLMNGGMGMEILDEKINGVDVLIPQGRLDASSAKDIKEKISSLTKEDRIKLVMDMSGVDFI